LTKLFIVFIIFRMIGAARLETFVNPLMPSEIRFEPRHRDSHTAMSIGQEVLAAVQTMPDFRPGTPVIVRNDSGQNGAEFPVFEQVPTGLANLVLSNDEELRLMAASLGISVVRTFAKVLVYDSHDDEPLGMHSDPAESITIADALLGTAWFRTPRRLGHMSQPGSRFVAHTGLGRALARHRILAPSNNRLVAVTRLHYQS